MGANLIFITSGSKLVLVFSDPNFAPIKGTKRKIEGIDPVHKIKEPPNMESIKNSGLSHLLVHLRLDIELRITSLKLSM